MSGVRKFFSRAIYARACSMLACLKICASCVVGAIGTALYYLMLSCTVLYVCAYLYVIVGVLTIEAANYVAWMSSTQA